MTTCPRPTRDNALPVRLLDRDAFNRLVAATRRNDNVFTRLKYLSTAARHDDRQMHMVIATRAREIIAAASLQHSPYDARRLWILGLSVDARHRRQGHATALLRSIFAHAAAHDTTVELSSFSTDGHAYLAPLIPRIHQNFPHVHACTSSRAHRLFDGTAPYTLDRQGNYTPAPLPGRPIATPTIKLT